MRLAGISSWVTPCACLARFIAIYVAIPPALYALDTERSIAQYGHATWSLQDGGLRGGVFSLTQSGDGWLWIGTEFGLLRFDGVRFSSWQPPVGERLPSQLITALAPAKSGGVWIGTRNSVWRWDGAAMQSFRTTDGKPELPVSAIREDRTGNVWIGTVGFGAGGIARVERNHLRYFSPAYGGFAGGGVLSLLEDRAGRIWLGCVDGLYGWDGSRFQAYRPPSPLMRVGPLTEDAGGEIIAWTSGASGLKRFVGGTFQSYPIENLGNRIPARVLLSDRNGGLWIGTIGQGVIRVHQGKADQFTRAQGLSGNTVLSLFEDREGSVWVGTDDGLDRFRDLPVTNLSKRDGLSDDSAGSALAARSGEVWIGTGAGLNSIRGNRIEIYGRSAGLPSVVIRSLFESRVGKLWVDTALGLALGSHGQFHPFDLPGSQRIRSISAVTEDMDGRLWFADLERGLISVQADTISHVLPWSLFNNRRALALQTDFTNGGLIIGFEEGGIAYYREGSPIRWYTEADGLGSGAVTDFHIDSDGSLWVATQGGLSRLSNGRVATLDATNGLGCDQIHAMVEDLDGAMWLNTPCGLQSISPGDLVAWVANPKSKVQPRIYTASDGMHLRSTANAFFRGAVRSVDGRLWFPVFDGVAVINPKSLHRNLLPPPVEIVGMRADDQAFEPKAGLRIGPIRKNLQIDYTALSFVDAARVRYRYKLEGYDEAWRDVMGRRQALYPTLPPRHYRFRVVAANNDGVWNETGAYIDFAVDPAFYQTTWFGFLCLLALAALLWSAYRFRISQVKARFEERLRERMRIGGELHDTLLQNLAAFALQLGGLSKIVMEQPDVVQERLTELRRDAEQSVREVRESVWDLRSSISEDKDFYEMVRESAEELTRGTALTLKTEISGRPEAIPQQMQKHLLRIVQEALRNAVRHAEATAIGLKITYTELGEMRILIVDNGRGFTLETASRQSGHWGLMTMQKRAEEIGARFSITTAPRRGTQIEITFPRILRPNHL